MSRLLLDLKHYDDAGRVKPNVALVYCVVFLCRTLVIFVMWLASRQDSNTLLVWFYPEQKYLYVGMVIGLPALIAYLLIAFREKIARKQFLGVFSLIRYLLLCSCILDFIFQCYLANKHHWQFSWSTAVILLLDCLVAFYILRDKHLILLTCDWRYGDNEASPH